MESFHWTILLGGSAFFFLGLKSAHRGLEAVAGSRMRVILGQLTSNRFTALLFGALVTVMLQSSSATSVMLISFTETKLLTLAQAIAVLLGADIGTTFTVFLLSIRKITEYALVVVAVGFLVQVISRHNRGRHVGEVLLGFGLIFYGMHLMSQAALPLKESPVAIQIFSFLAGNPLATLIFSVLIAGALSSAGTIGIALALAHAGTISFEAAMPIVLGANIGTCITAILSALGSSVEGQRVAGAHTAAKVAGVALIFPFLTHVATIVEKLSVMVTKILPQLDPGVAGRIVLTHIFFNVALALVFLPLIQFLVWGVKWLIPEPPASAEEFGPKYLDQAALDTPALAFSQVKREIMRLSGIVADQIGRCLLMFSRGTNVDEEIDRVREEDDKIDRLEKAIRFYLAKLSSETLSEVESRRQLALLSIGQDLEEIGDSISKEMLELALKKKLRHNIFSQEGWEDLRTFQTMVKENMELMLAFLAQPSEEIMAKLLRHEKKMSEKEQELRQSHLNRLSQGLKESFDTSSIHLDILSNLRRINTKVIRIVEMAKEL